MKNSAVNKSVLCCSGGIQFAALLDQSAALALLWDHRVGGRALVPATAFFELAAAAAAALTADGSPPPAAEVTALTAVAILGPKVLQPASSTAGVSGRSDSGAGGGNSGGGGDSGRKGTPSGGGGNVLVCEVQPVSGQLKLASVPAVDHTSAVPHVTCRYAED